MKNKLKIDNAFHKSSMKKKKGIIVLGMHRSGTSILTKVLQVMGADLGTDYNTNVYEFRKLVRINTDILNILGSKWNLVKRLPHRWHKSLKLEKQKRLIEMTLINEFHSKDLFAIKDPRISILLPLYMEVFNKLNIEPHLVIIERNDFEVCKSLALSQNRLFLTRSLKICQIYRESIDQFSQPYKKVRISFDDLVNNTRKTINLIKQTLDLPLRDYSNCRDELNRAIDKKRKHHNLNLFTFPLIVLPCLIPPIYYLGRRGRDYLKNKLERGKKDKKKI